MGEKTTEDSEKIDFTKKQYNLRCVRELKVMRAPTTKFSETLYDYLKTFREPPARTMYGQFIAIILWTERLFRKYCYTYRFVIEYDKRNVIHIHAIYSCENRMKRRWLLEKSKIRGFVFSKPIYSYDHAWNYLIKDIDEMQEIYLSRNPDEKVCLHRFIFHDKEKIKLF